MKCPFFDWLVDTMPLSIPLNHIFLKPALELVAILEYDSPLSFFYIFSKGTVILIIIIFQRSYPTFFLILKVAFVSFIIFQI